MSSTVDPPEHDDAGRHTRAETMAESGAAATSGTRGQQGVRVELANLSRSFGSVHALDGMDLTIDPGELVVLLGPSGCGKTTALRVLAGLEDADEGRIMVGDRDVSGIPTNKRDMGMVFQAYSLFPHMTATQNVSFGLRLQGKSKAECARIAGEFLDLVGLSEQADRFAQQMSGGQQQRVALARALAIQPEVLLLDEPLSALDAKVRVQLRDEIRRIQLDLGITTLFVTHDQEEALAVADRVGVMWQGKIQQIASPETLYSQPVNGFVAKFVGQSSMLPGTANGDEATVLGHRIPLLPGSPTSGEVTVLVRPEAMSFTARSDTDAGSIHATITNTSFLGSTGRAEARLADGTVATAQIPSSEVSSLAVGDPVDVILTPTPALAIDPRDERSAA